MDSKLMVGAMLLARVWELEPPRLGKAERERAARVPAEQPPAEQPPAPQRPADETPQLVAVSPVASPAERAPSSADRTRLLVRLIEQRAS